MTSCIDDAHIWRTPEPARVPHPRCDRPNRLVCLVCAEVRLARCGATRESMCVPCSASHRRRLTTIGIDGARRRSPDTPTGVFAVTLTGPGQDVIPWDRSVCNHDPALQCSGKIGCRGEFEAAMRWNSFARKQISYVPQMLRRRLNCSVEVWGSWEPQERAVLHRHMLVRVEGPISDQTMRRAVKQVAAELGFGRQLTVDMLTLDEAVAMFDDHELVEVEQPETSQAVVRSVRYCAKYATKCTDHVKKLGMFNGKLLDPDTGELRRLRSWSATHRWGITMKQVKRQQQLFAARARNVMQHQVEAWEALGAPGEPEADGAPGALDLNRATSTITGDQIPDSAAAGVCPM